MPENGSGVRNIKARIVSGYRTAVAISANGRRFP